MIKSCNCPILGVRLQSTVRLLLCRLIRGQNTYMLFAGWEGRIVKNCDRGLENAARGRRLRATSNEQRAKLDCILLLFA